MSSSKPSGRYTVTGPHEEDHPVPNLGAGLSCAQTFASRHRKLAAGDELTYYIRDLASDEVLARVTKELDGSVTTLVTS
jgi:hypothetical protein